MVNWFYPVASKWCRILSVLALCGLVSACSFKTTYKFLDWLVPWYVDDYVSLNDIQERLLDDELARLLNWHQSTELERYAADMALFREQFAAEQWTAEQWLAQLDQMRNHQKRLLAEALPSLAKLARSLSDEQVDELFDNIEQQVAKSRKKSAERTEQEWLEYWYDNTEEGLEKWLDSLTKPQQNILTQWATTRPYDEALIERQGEFWMARLREILAQRFEAGLEQDLRDLLLAEPEQTAEGFQDYLAQVRYSYASLYAQLQQTLTPKQLRYADKSLAKWQDDFTDLAARYEPKETEHGTTDARLAEQDSASR
ncbi:hypothetical protein K0504_16310 [Neiella marina]|uniref:Lipoprotein n=1 Tax=Neiella holothuriorum TaxID=2870530 RepID=A0ABS7EJS3_9GAMM|nr:DUF6279 family lipoprotein [Neiella holothuriorum]MBW8192603.1 hypothetical protein [Neiella holothuriorum]